MRLRAFLILPLLAIFFSGGISSAEAKEPSREPVLAIETGLHGSMITQLSVDASDRYLATGSHDKTVRVWDARTGALLNIIRPPIGQGNEGKIYAVSISPDGETISCGGWTGFEWDGTDTVYIFRRKDGKLLKTITGLPEVIENIEYSHDGKVLAVTLAAKGVRFYRTLDYKLVSKDESYSSDVYGADFSPDGKFATVSFDGLVRLYNANHEYMTSKSLPGGMRPFSVSFSPDGRQLAIGYDDTPAIDIISAEDLAHIFSPDTSGLPNGSFAKLTWSSDGRYLYAGGRYKKNGSNVIRKWADAGRGEFIDLEATDDTVMYLIPLNSGGVAFASSSPSIGIVGPDDVRSVYITSDIVNYRTERTEFLVSSDGFTVQFFYEKGMHPAKFTAQSRTLQVGLSNDIEMFPARTHSELLEIKDWADSFTPSVNGKAVALKPFELSKTLAIAPSDDIFILGTNWYLRAVGIDGEMRWSVPAPAPTNNVNVSLNGKIVVASYGDGTIRWYRLSDGYDMLSFFPHKDGERWIAWTRSGYFDAQEDAPSLIRWVVNRGKDEEPDVYPEARFGAKFFRPAVVDNIVRTSSEEAALRAIEEAENPKDPNLTIRTYGNKSRTTKYILNPYKNQKPEEKDPPK